MWKTIYYVRKAVFTVFVATFLIALGAALTSVYTLEKYSTDTVAKIFDGVTEDVSVSGNKGAVGYYVKEYEGVIGVFDSCGELMYTVEVYTKTLPDRDRMMLYEGIHADSYGELLEILGDYTA